MDELLLWVPVVLAVIVAIVVLQWLSTRERWRTATTTLIGEGAYRSQVTSALSAPRFPKRIAVLSTLTSLWGVITLLFAAAGFILTMVIASSDGSAIFIGIVSCSGVLLGISAFVLSSRIIRRSDRAPHTIRWYTAFGITHHIAVALAFAFVGHDTADMFPYVLIPCAIGIGLTALVPWGTRGTTFA